MTPPPAAAARLDSVPLPLTKLPSTKKSLTQTLPAKTSLSQTQTLPAAGAARSAGDIAPARTDRPLRGIGLILTATVFLGCSDATGKYLSLTLPAIEITWIRFLVFALIVLPTLLRGKPFQVMRTDRAKLHIFRAVGLLGSSLLFVSGLRYLPVAEASATGFVAPMFVTALSIFVLGEKVGLRRWIATAVGLLGVLIILRPGSSAFHPAALFSVFSALCWAATLITTRLMSGTERAETTMAYSAIVGLAVVSALVPFVWVTPTWHDIFFGVLIGVASTAGQWVVVLAFRYGDASVLAPYSYTQLLVVSTLGFLVFGEIPDVWTVAGAATIIGSGLYTAHRERLRRLQTSQAEPSPNP